MRKKILFINISRIKIHLLLLFLLFTAMNSFAQNITVKGQVLDEETKTPIPAVNILIKGTTLRSATNANGIYTLSGINPDAILVFSYIGYMPQEISLRGQTQLNVILKSDHGNLKEVVVTALGIKKEKKAIGYAVQEVKGETLEKVKSPTAIGALAGKVAGLNISNTTDLFQKPAISLRGQTPLIVIDGIPDPTADPYKINADDIESITVLKGTAAGALYGSIGVNGAIMYTTKRGKKGKTIVEVNSSTMFQTGYTVVPKVQTQYGGGNNGKYAYVDGSGGGTEGGGWIWGPKLDQKDPGTPSGYYETPQYNSPVDPLTGKLVPLPWISRGKDNIKNFFRTGMLSSNSVTVSTGGENGSFRISAANIYQKGTVPNTGVNNSSFSVAGNYALSPKLTIDGRLTYNREFSNNYPSTGYGPTNILYNLLLWIGPDLDIRDLKNYWLKGKEGMQQRNYNLSWYNNPYFITNEQLNGYRKDNSFGNFSLNYQIARDFSAKIRSGFNQYGTDEDSRYPYSYIGYGTLSKGDYSYTKSTHFDITTDLILSYKHKFNDNFNLAVIGGAANSYNNTKGIATTTDGLNIPGFYNLANSTNPLKGSNYLQERQINSLYTMADLEMYRFLYLSFTGRRDQTSTLPVNNSAYFYPSGSISAVLSDALKLPETISFLKVRTSVAKVNSGSITTDPNNFYAQIQTYNIGNKWNGTSSLNWPDSYKMPGLVPNTVLSWESGVALGLFKNRLNVDVTYFQNKEYNNFQLVPISETSGYSSLLQNANVYQRKGWEFMISGTPVKTSSFEWESSFNFSNSHRWLKEATLSQDGYIGNLKAGERADKIFTSLYQTTPDGKIIYDTNGMPLNDPYQRSIGYADANWLYGWQNTFKYKNISLSIAVDGRIGGSIYSTTNYKMWWGGTAPGTVNQYRDDANAGKSTYVGKGVVVTSGKATYDNHGNIISDDRKYAPNTTPVNYIAYNTGTGSSSENNYFYYSGTYLKMREIALTYTLPQKWIKKQKVFQAASVSFIGNNLFILARIPNVDPDAESDNLQTPSMRSIGFNFNFKF